MQLLLFPDYINLKHQRTMIGLSGGINSAALLCYMAKYYPAKLRPQQVFLYYAHLDEHSPDTFDFVQACCDYAKRHFAKISITITRNSVLDCFRQQKYIPHPKQSPCTLSLKIKPIAIWQKKNQIDIDLIGYIASEKRRKFRLLKQKKPVKLSFPIIHFKEGDCFRLVRGEIGWYPAIYDIREAGKPVFKHNNCIPCKNWHGVLTSEFATRDFLKAQKYYPDYIARAQILCRDLKQYWGRPDEGLIKETTTAFPD